MVDQLKISPTAGLSLLALAAIWGASFLGFAIGLDALGPLSLVAHRVFWGAVGLWILVAITHEPIPRGAKLWAAFAVMGLLNNAIPFSLIAWAQTRVESGLAAILNGTTAFFGIAIAALVFADERFTQAKLMGTALAFGGVVVIIGPGILQALDLRATAQIALIAASLSYGMASVWARRFLGGLPPLAAATGMVTASSLWMVPVALCFEGAPTLALSPLTWTAIAFLGFGCTTIAYLLYYRVLRLAGSGNLMLVTLLIPPMAIFWGWAVLGEQLSPSVWSGFGLIALGLVVLDGRVLRRKSA